MKLEYKPSPPPLAWPAHQADSETLVLVGGVINPDSNKLASNPLQNSAGFKSKMKPLYGSQNYYKGMKPPGGFQVVDFVPTHMHHTNL